MKKIKLFFFTGAGVSAESGLQTFRNSPDGLWNNYKIEEVCTPQAWEKNPALVLEFYNHRRKQCIEAKPNRAHELIAELQNNFDVTVVTQNVDNLHERAGSTHVIHLHGELMKSRSTSDATLIYPCQDEIKIGEVCEKGSQLRPHIVWFGEMLDDEKVYQAVSAASACDVCVIIGSSLQVSPANQIPGFIPRQSRLIIIDPDNLEAEFNTGRSAYHIRQGAVDGMQQLYDSLMRTVS
jgi:NAD-dependent deacetylase